MSDSKKYKISSDCMGAIWFIGWLFTIGFLQLTFWKGVLAILLWPYYIGEYLNTTLNSVS